MFAAGLVFLDECRLVPLAWGSLCWTLSTRFFVCRCLTAFCWSIVVVAVDVDGRGGLKRVAEG